MTKLAVNNDENLVGSHPRDLALLKIMELRKDPASEKTRHPYSLYRKAFVYLAKSFFSLNSDLIKANFDQETIRGLEELIIQKAKKWSFATQVFMYCVPLVGWLSAPAIKYNTVFDDGRNDMGTHFSYRFLRSRRKLKKIGVDPMSLLIKDWNIKDKEKK